MKVPNLKVHVEPMFHILNMRTRFPFQYGIASLTALPHLIVRVKIDVEGHGVSTGLGAEGLPPKWFTKNPDTRFEEDIPDFFDVIKNAAKLATDAPCTSFFRIWQHVYTKQAEWAKKRKLAPLLANLGVSLIERAILDALCRSLGVPIHKVLQNNLTGIDLSAIRPELAGMEPRHVLMQSPLKSINVRHTIGLGDPLSASDVPHDKKLNDGLPHTLEECIHAYGLSYFKIKVRGDRDADMERLRNIAGIFNSCGIEKPKFTLDGNEQFSTVDRFREFYETCMEDPQIHGLLHGLLLIEQPLHRDIALKHSLHSWKDRPPLIIDESDGALNSLPKALNMGYNGTSHKNCKGIVKGLANVAMLKKQQIEDPEKNFLLTGEDLANVGPIALNQDLAIMAAFGISHVERNGHHYFRGLSMFPGELSEELALPDLYRIHEDGFPTLDIRDGRLNLSQVNKAPFGTEHLLDTAQFTPLAEWSAESLA